MSDIDSLRAELALAQSQGRGTDAGRIKKALAALGDKPEPQLETAPAATARAEVAGAHAEATEPPKGRASPRSKQSKS